MIKKITDEQYVGRYFRVYVHDGLVSSMNLIVECSQFGAWNFEEMSSELRELRKMIWPGYSDAATQTHTMRVP